VKVEEYVVETHFFAEKDSPSDDQLFIHEIHFVNNDFVDSGRKILTVEGSKAVFEIEMPIAGYIQFYVTTSSYVKIGQPLFSVSPHRFQKVTVPEPLINHSISPKSVALNPNRFSKAAMKLIMEKGMDETIFDNFEFVTSQIVLEKLSNHQTTITSGKEIKDFESVAFIGGGQGAEVLFSRLHKFSQSNLVKGYFDSRQTKYLQGVTYLGTPTRDEISSHFSKSNFQAMVITVTSNMQFRKEMSKIARDLGIPLASYIDSQSFVSDTAKIEEGCIILDSARVGHNTHLDRNIFLSGFVNIDHDCSVGQDSTFGPGVMFSARVKVGPGCSFGSCIAVEPRVQIGSNCIIASGSVITRNIPDEAVVKLKSNIMIREKK
jgi:acetyltransferase-like isoleucine patch superfamily enzyme